MFVLDDEEVLSKELRAALTSAIDTSLRKRIDKRYRRLKKLSSEELVALMSGEEMRWKT